MSTCTSFFVSLVSLPTLRQRCIYTPPQLSTTLRCGLLLPAQLDKQEAEVEHHYIRNSLHYWEKFYQRHKNKFFKDRHYLEKDWGQYFCDSDANDTNSPQEKVVLEVGCGAGNTIFPLIAAYPNLSVQACDFSPQAVSLVKIFMLSAVAPNKMPSVLQNLKRVLKPNGHILLRDYAFGDSGQVKLQNRNQTIGENFCFRGDGTRISYHHYLKELASTLWISIHIAGKSRIIPRISQCQGVGSEPFSARSDQKYFSAPSQMETAMKSAIKLYQSAQQWLFDHLISLWNLYCQ